MPARNVGINSTFEQQRQVINAISEDVFALTSSIVGFGSTGITVNVDYAPNAGVATYSEFSGIATYAATAGIVSYSNLAGVATYASSAGSALQAQTAAFADVVGVATYASIAGIATYALVSGVSTYSSVAGISSYSSLSGNAGFATVAATASVANYSPIAGFATVAANLTGTPNLNVGIVTATKFAADDAEFTGILTAQSLKAISGYILSPDNIQSIQLFSSSGEVGFSTWIRTFGIRNYSGNNVVNIAGTDLVLANKIFGDGSSLSGIITSLIAGTNVSISNTDGEYTISAIGGGGSGDSYWESTSVGIGTTQKVGIGTTAPTEFLTVRGNASITGNIILTGEISSPTRIKFGSGGENIKIGDLTGGFGAANIAIGDQTLFTNNGGTGHNIGIGQLSLFAVTSGQYNIALGDRAGQNLTSGSYNVIIGGYNGQTGLDIRSSSRNVVISDGEGNIRQYINSSGNVGIKTTVVTEALTVAGVVSATSFYGTLNAGQLTGSLPAIDGSALIGVVGSGSGVIIQDDSNPIGTAGTINFGSNISVSFASGIATVSGSGLATYANVSGIATYATTAGVATNAQGLTGTPSIVVDQLEAADGLFTGNITVVGDFNKVDSVGVLTARSGIKIGSPTTQATLSANGSAVFSGIITAASFSGSGSGLTNIPAGQLTGSLPAIDGSQLLNVTAAGTGIVIEDDNINVGSAVTVNFGTGLDVTFSSGIATITSSGGSLQSRTIVTGVTTSIPNLGIGNTDITGFKSYSLMKVGLSTAGWIRLYTDSTSRLNDATRSVGEDPAPGSGVIAEVVITGISTEQMITPFVMGGNMDEPITDKIYVAIQNLSGSSQTITANLTILQLEA